MVKDKLLLKKLESHGLHIVPYAWGTDLKKGVVKIEITYEGNDYSLLFQQNTEKKEWYLVNAK
ncbi:hypothetical protein MM213_09800 [Belliella sp. R4-6]|uniref:Uncharacterized protein n=1 Tax=Belliella alkalica TaxID=1730871 RepID=A0ABS9VBH0_9BACT|nr:hypothetical protein [Belliella alkalica]MCH7413777.1 hypothetical protein [Belliella alkalica]